MRKFICFIFLSIMVLSTGCSTVKDVFESGKAKLAREISEKIGSELSTSFKAPEFASLEASGVDCQLEAEETEADARELLYGFLKVQDEDKKSLTSALPMICQIGVTQIVPAILVEAGSSRPCLSLLGATKIKALAPKVCSF